MNVDFIERGKNEGTITVEYNKSNTRENTINNTPRQEIMKEKNIVVKKEMASELVEIGLPLSSIKIILNIERKNLDNLL